MSVREMEKVMAALINFMRWDLMKFSFIDDDDA